MQVFDITGSIQGEMWSYGDAYPDVSIKTIMINADNGNTYYAESFEGMHSQTGTYLETPAHYYGYEKSYFIEDVPIEKLVDVECKILQIRFNEERCANIKRVITKEDLEKCKCLADIEEGDVILIGTGWDKFWLNKEYIKNSPYFTYDAMMWVLSKKPSILASDIPCWDHWENPQGFFERFYEQDILMLGPCANVSKIGQTRGKLTALPLNVKGTCCAPCRAIITAE